MTEYKLILLFNRFLRRLNQTFLSFYYPQRLKTGGIPMQKIIHNTRLSIAGGFLVTSVSYVTTPYLLVVFPTLVGVSTWEASVYVAIGSAIGSLLALMLSTSRRITPVIGKVGAILLFCSGIVLSLTNLLATAVALPIMLLAIAMQRMGVNCTIQANRQYYTTNHQGPSLRRVYEVVSTSIAISSALGVLASSTVIDHWSFSAACLMAGGLSLIIFTVYWRIELPAQMKKKEIEDKDKGSLRNANAILFCISAIGINILFGLFMALIPLYMTKEDGGVKDIPIIFCIFALCRLATSLFLMPKVNRITYSLENIYLVSTVICSISLLNVVSNPLGLATYISLVAFSVFYSVASSCAMPLLIEKTGKAESPKKYIALHTFAGNSIGTPISFVIAAVIFTSENFYISATTMFFVAVVTNLGFLRNKD